MEGRIRYIGVSAEGLGGAAAPPVGNILTKIGKVSANTWFWSKFQVPHIIGILLPIHIINQKVWNASMQKILFSPVVTRIIRMRCC